MRVEALARAVLTNRPKARLGFTNHCRMRRRRMTALQSLAPFEALERFRETHPDLATVNQILAMSEERFVQEYVAAFGGDPRKARATYRAAQAQGAQNAL